MNVSVIYQVAINGHIATAGKTYAWVKTEDIEEDK